MSEFMEYWDRTAGAATIETETNKNAVMGLVYDGFRTGMPADHCLLKITGRKPSAPIKSPTILGGGLGPIPTILEKPQPLIEPPKPVKLDLPKDLGPIQRTQLSEAAAKILRDQLIQIRAGKNLTKAAVEKVLNVGYQTLSRVEKDSRIKEELEAMIIRYQSLPSATPVETVTVISDADLKELRATLRQRRIDGGFTQAWVAEFLNTTVSDISYCETRSKDAEKIQRYINAL